MKAVEEVTAIVIDYGSFISLADKLSETCKKVYYHSPYEEEFHDIVHCVIGDGLPKVERIDDFMEPKIFDSIDLWVFPDIGYGGLQHYLRREGKAVWGAMGASDFELYRTKFIGLLSELDLPVVPSARIVGLTALTNHLKRVQNKWVKINRYRRNMETWKHRDYDHSIRELEREAVEFGGAKESVVYIVQDPVDTTDEDAPVIEIGYDGWTVDGEYPEESFQGYEKKNELYLGSCLSQKQWPEEVAMINEAFSPLFRSIGYRCFASWEARVKGNQVYCIDPTFRMPGQTGEQLLETCTNLASVIWEGAHGNLIKPIFAAKVAAEATMHYTDCNDYWRTLKIPESVQRWFKLYHYCVIDGVFHFPPNRSDELGVVMGMANTVQKAYEHLKDNLDKIDHEPVQANLTEFADLIREIQEAEDLGIEFTTEELPGPAMVLEEK